MEGSIEGSRFVERQSTFSVLVGFVAHFPSDTIHIRDFVASLGGQAFGLLLVAFSLPNMIPLPGISSVFGWPLIILGAQMLFGLRQPWLPERIGRISIERRTMTGVLNRATPWAEKAERRMRPRLPALSGQASQRCVGFMVLVLGSILIIPIPGGNFIPAVSVALMALGLGEKDGIFVLAGVLLGLIAAGVIIGASSAMIIATVLFFSDLFHSLVF